MVPGGGIDVRSAPVTEANKPTTSTLRDIRPNLKTNGNITITKVRPSQQDVQNKLLASGLVGKSTSEPECEVINLVKSNPGASNPQVMRNPYLQPRPAAPLGQLPQMSNLDYKSFLNQGKLNFNFMIKYTSFFKDTCVGGGV